MAPSIQLLDNHSRRLILRVPFSAVEMQGLDIPPLQIYSVRAPSQHGSTVTGWVFQDRPINIILHISAGCYKRLFFRKGQLHTQLTPINSPMTLRARWGPADYYDLRNVWYDTGFDLGTRDIRGGGKQRVPFRLMAKNPIWWAPEKTETDTSPGGAWNPTLNCYNLGNFYAYPTVKLVGPMDSGAILEFEPAGGYIEIAEAIGAGETYTVTTGFGERHVLDNAGDYAPLDEDTTLALCYLEIDPTAPVGLNTIELTATGTVLNVSTITATWNDGWIGLRGDDV